MEGGEKSVPVITPAAGGRGLGQGCAMDGVGGGGHSGSTGGGGGGHSGIGGGGGGHSGGGGGGGDGKEHGFSHEVHIVHSSCSLDVVVVAAAVHVKLNWIANVRVNRVSKNGLVFAIFFSLFRNGCCWLSVFTTIS